MPDTPAAPIDKKRINMKRPTLVIASRHVEVARAVHQLLDAVTEPETSAHSVDFFGFSCAAELFQRLDALGNEQLRETMLVLDLTDEVGDPWDVEDLGKDDGLAAQIVLSYPEIYTVFLANQPDFEPLLSGPTTTPFSWPQFQATIGRYHFVPLERLLHVSELMNLHAQDFRTIFDATGLRSYLKWKVQEKLLKPLSRVHAWAYQPFSQSRAIQNGIVADEEVAFLFLNAYAVYKFGLRAWLASTKVEFIRLLGDSAQREMSGQASTELQEDNANEGEFRPLPVPDQFTTALVDWHLAFRDETGDYSRPLVNRANAFRSEKVRHPVVITSFGDEVAADRSANDNWLPRTIVLPKPYGGLFDLLKGKPKESPDARRPPENALARVFECQWKRFRHLLDSETMPGNHSVASNGKQGLTLTPHSAPYACALVAGHLLTRARAIRSSLPADTESWIHVALLAGEAKELLGGMSRTTTFEAITLQNEAEAYAEVSFLGSATTIEVSKRLEVLREEVEIVQHAGRGPGIDSPPSEEMERLTCLMQAVNQLRRCFFAHEHIEAAEECLREFARHQLCLDRMRAFSRCQRAIQNVCGRFLEFFILILGILGGRQVSRVSGDQKPWWNVFSPSILMTRLITLRRWICDDEPPAWSMRGDRSSVLTAVQMCSGTESKGVYRSLGDWAWYFTFGYPDFATRAGTSALRLLAVSSIWVLVFSVVYFALLQTHPSEVPLRTAELAAGPTNHVPPQSTGWGMALWHSALVFILQPSISDIEQMPVEYLPLRGSLIYRSCVFVELAIAYLHLGLLVSVLYRRITKRAP